MNKIISIALSLVLALSLTAVYTASAEETIPATQTDTGDNAYEVSISNGVGVLFCKEPGDENTALMFIPDEAPLRITEIRNGYGKTVYRGVEGWVSMENLHHTGETNPIRYVCESAETFRKIIAMTESDKLLLAINLKSPVLEGEGTISCAELGLSADEFEKIKQDHDKIGELVCEAFAKDYSLQGAMIGPSSICCRLSLDEINRIMNDERLVSLYYYMSDEIDTDETVNAGAPDEIDTDLTWADSIPEEIDTDSDWADGVPKVIDTDKDSLPVIFINKGDVNSDGVLDMLDVTLTQKAIAKLDTDCNTELADMDENSVVDLQDVVQMQKAIAGLI